MRFVAVIRQLLLLYKNKLTTCPINKNDAALLRFFLGQRMVKDNNYQGVNMKYQTRFHFQRCFSQIT